MTKQEPVAWVKDNLICPENGYETTITEQHPKDLGWTPLYTHPCALARTAPSWQKLSDDEIDRIYCEVQDNCVKDFPSALYAAWINALKEKNT